MVSRAHRGSGRTCSGDGAMDEDGEFLVEFRSRSLQRCCDGRRHLRLCLLHGGQKIGGDLGETSRPPVLSLGRTPGALVRPIDEVSLLRVLRQHGRTISTGRPS